VRVALKSENYLRASSNIFRHCDDEFGEFVETMEILGDRLGPMLLQFPYFIQAEFETCDDFYSCLMPFLRKLPEATLRT
jgi:uncharacterized protein YecE (DUF72 family)